MPTKICKLCGKEFYTVSTAMYCKGPHFSKCEVCGKEYDIGDPNQPRRTCSRKCSIQLRKIDIAKKPRKCELCGKIFYSTSNTARYCDGPHYRPCPVCGKPVEIKDPSVPPVSCSIECSNKLREQTCLANYGVRIASQAEMIRQKLHDSAISNRSQYIESLHEKYGPEYDNIAQVPEIRAKISATVKSEECQSKIRATIRSHFGVDYGMQSDECKSRFESALEQKYGVPYYVMSDECHEKSGQIISHMNRGFGKLLSSNKIAFKYEYRIDKFSYDIYLPDFNTLIEIDPTYTHDVVGNHWNTHVDASYHLNKTQVARNCGFECIHVWDWDDKYKIVELFTDKLQIDSSNCSADVIDAHQAALFRQRYDLSSVIQPASDYFGLWYGDELVCIMSFKRGSDRFEWELLSICTNSKYMVNGLSVLWNKFIETYHPLSVIAYCDLSKPLNPAYSEIGMQLDHIVEPRKLWSKKQEVVADDASLSEQQMLDNKWLPVYDCGQAVYTYTAPM